jgi:glycosyltransferase involved in cell wall biosynthesis
MPDVIIPVLNEAAAFPGLLSAMPAGHRVTVVDNGSNDDSAEVAARLGAHVVREPKLGFGAACWAGLTAVARDDEVVCFMDGDGSLDPTELPRVAEPFQAGDADLVLRTAGWRIGQVPVTYARRTGKSKVTGTLRGTLRAVHDMGLVLR